MTSGRTIKCVGQIRALVGIPLRLLQAEWHSAIMAGATDGGDTKVSMIDEFETGASGPLCRALSLALFSQSDK